MRIAVAILALCFILPSPAPATGLVSSIYDGGGHRHWHKPRKPRKVKRHRRKHHHHHEKKHPRGAPLVSLKDLPMCDKRLFSVTSTPHQSIENAKDAARKLWKAQTQMLIGGAYMDPSLSVDRKWLCGITDPLDSGRDKLAGNTELYRCYFAARPCRSDIENESDWQRGDGYR